MPSASVPVDVVLIVRVVLDAANRALRREIDT
jgi:hypothetical protein